MGGQLQSKHFPMAPQLRMGSRQSWPILPPFQPSSPFPAGSGVGGVSLVSFMREHGHGPQIMKSSPAGLGLTLYPGSVSHHRLDASSNVQLTDL